MAPFVYILCTLTSGLCAALLLRNASRAETRLLFWSGAAFVGLTIANILLFVDLVIFPNHDLTLLRNIANLTAMALMLFGLIWERD